MESQYIKINNSNIHYLETGTGDPILFIHGNPTSSYLWRNIIPKVSKFGRCIALDLIGMGKSDKPDLEYRFIDHYKYLEEFINRLGLKNITLVLHDWGSALGLHYFDLNESNIKGIVFMEAIIKTHKDYDSMGSDGEFFKELRDPIIGKQKIIYENFFIEVVLQGGIIRKLTDIELNYYRKPYLKKENRKPILMWPNEVSIAGIPENTTGIIKNYMEKLYNSKLPKLLLYGEPGALIKKEEIRMLRDRCSNLTIQNIGQGIHFLQEDNPENITAEITKWMA